MSDFTSNTLTSSVTDLSKRVHYSTGLVLGVDEFEQEQAHLLERDRLHTRALHGYGTVYGLRLELEESSELIVRPGLAVVPSGQHVCIGQPQCAALEDWVKAHDKDDFASHLETSEADESILPVYVVLCYQECATDAVPIPGGPCRSADDSTAPSRIAEDFQLQLCLTPPAQASEEATRAFGAFLRRIQITEHENRGLDGDAFEEMVEEELSTILSQIDDKDAPVTGSETDEPIYLRRSSARTSLKKAFQRWSLLAARGISVSSNRCGVLDGNDSRCVLLGQVNLTLSEDNGEFELVNVSEEDISVDDRPVLFETRLLQEYLVHGSLDRETIRRTLATVSVEASETLRVWFHHGKLVELTGDSPLEVEVNGQSVPVSSVSPVGAGRNAFDVTLGSSVNPGDRVAVRVNLTNIEEQDTDSSLLDRIDEDTFDYLDRTGETARVYTVAPISTLRLGDLVDVDVPESSDTEHVLAWNPDAEMWQNKVLEDPDTLSIEEVAATLPTLPFATADMVNLDSLSAMETENSVNVDRAREVQGEIAESIEGRAMAIRVRFHPNTHENLTTVDNVFDVEAFGVQIYSERNRPMSRPLYLKKEEVLERTRIARNVFVLFVRENAVRRRPYLRLRFNLEETKINQRDEGGEVTNTYAASEWLGERPVKWLGHDGTQYVTVFATWTPVGGDLSGPAYAPRVAGVQGTPVSEIAPEEGDRLAYDGSTWRPEPLPESEPPPEPEPVSSNAEEGLTRIVATNWPHAAATGGELPTVTVRARSVTDREVNVAGLAVAFGGEAISDRRSLEIGGDHDVRVDTLSNEVFHAYTRQPDGSALRPIQIQPRAVLPLVRVGFGRGGQIVSGTIALGEERARGMLFVFPDELGDAPRELGVFDVRIRGDAIVDVSGRALDAEFTRSQLPTSDRPAGGEAGVQGGTFESWFYLFEQIPQEERNRQVLREIFAT